MKSLFPPFLLAIRRSILCMAVVTVAVFSTACDSQRISELEEGVATEGDVKMKFGEPEKVWDGENGARIFEYSRQPAGAKNYMITIGPDGKMTALRQVLAPHVFAKIEPGMPMETEWMFISFTAFLIYVTAHVTIQIRRRPRHTT